jgi:hypothetical protein
MSDEATRDVEVRGSEMEVRFGRPCVHLSQLQPRTRLHLSSKRPVEGHTDYERFK